MTRLSLNYLLDIYDDTTINEKEMKINKYRVECIFLTRTHLVCLLTLK